MLKVDHESELRDFDGDYEDYLYALGELSHKSINGPRDTHVGENVFAFEWEVMNLTVRRDDDPPNVLLASILWSMDRRLTQRHASVAASFITWLGTNCGMAFVDTARRLSNAGSRVIRSPDDAFIAAWSIENRRRPNSTRLIDSILAPEDHYGADLFTGMSGLRRAPDLSIEDHETIEHVAAWLSCDRAKEFITRCEHLIKIRNRCSALDTIKIVTGVSK